MTTAANRILAVLVLGMAGTALPIHGEELNRESDRTGTFASRFSFGVLGGTNQTAGRPRIFAETRPTTIVGTELTGWLVGGFVEADLSARLSVQAGLSFGRSQVWDRFEFDRDTATLLGLAAVTYSGQPIGSAEIPATLNYRLGSANWRPVIGGGFVVGNPGYGAVAQFGLERRVHRRLTVAPLVRYFRWTTGLDAKYRVGVPKNQVQVLLALTF